MHMPVSMRALKKAVEITFSDPISSNSNPQAKSKHLGSQKNEKTMVLT
jgi:hypothetical protein